jgi:hypothetical protein
MLEWNEVDADLTAYMCNVADHPSSADLENIRAYEQLRDYLKEVQNG